MRHFLENYCLPTMPTRYDSWGPNHIWLHTTLEGPWLQYMIVEVCWDGLWTLSFGLSLSHGHGSWLMCEVTMTPMLAYMPACLGDNNNMVMLYDMVCNGMAWVWYDMGMVCGCLAWANGDSVFRPNKSPVGSANLLLYVQGSDLKVGGSCWHDVSSDGRTLLPLSNWTL